MSRYNIPFEELFMESYPGQTFGDQLLESIVTGVLPVADPGVLLGSDDEFDINDSSTWAVDPLNNTRMSLGEALSSGALHRSSISTAKSAAGATDASQAPVDAAPPTAPDADDSVSPAE